MCVHCVFLVVHVIVCAVIKNERVKKNMAFVLIDANDSDNETLPPTQ